MPNFSSYLRLEAIPNISTVNAITLSSAITLSYLALYTGYDKETKALKPSNLLDLVLLRRGIDWTLVELNKAISLSGLTCVILAYLPEVKEQKRELLFISMSMLWTHTIYSFYKFWQFNPQKLWTDKLVKRVSAVLGSLGQVALVGGYFYEQVVDPTVLILTTIGFSIGHFVTMEIDYKYRLQVRPYAYLPFPAAVYTLYQYFIGSK